MTAEKTSKTLLVFRRDLRLEDNTALAKAAARGAAIVPCFILDTRQTTPEQNPYFGNNSFSFMLESLAGLAEDLARRGGRLFVFAGNPAEVIKNLIEKDGIGAVFFNRDYTPFALRRDKEIAALCAAKGVPCEISPDLLLHEPEAIRTGAGTPYSVFTPFYRAASALPVKLPAKLSAARFYAGALHTKTAVLPKPTVQIASGRKTAQKLLENIERLKDYEQGRDFLTYETSGLSPHLRFGTCSVREAFHALAPISPLAAKQLYWRDFFTHAAFHFPHVFGHAFRQKYDGIKWPGGEEVFKKWKEGKTGYPAVDAGMRELAGTGRMHNRARMIAASFLVKNLHVDWRLGERYFAQTLIDYDPAVNNGNWQWCASTGCDSQPYFRIFNPWLQLKRFDADCLYVKRWLPELAKLSDPEIFVLQKPSAQRPAGYPAPITDYKSSSAETKAIYSALR